MQGIAKLIKEYLNEWIECYYCNDMYKVSNITSDNEDNPICKDCLINEIDGGMSQVLSSLRKYKENKESKQ